MTLMGSVMKIRNASIENPEIPISSASVVEYLGGGAQVTSGVTVNEKTAMGLPAVWRAATLTAGVCASLPLKAFARNDESRQPLAKGSLAELLDDPHPDMSPYEFWETIYLHLLVWGNAYLLKLRDQHGKVVELWPLHPARVKPGRTSTDVGAKVYLVDGREPYTDREICHVPGIGYDGVCGISVVSAMREAVGLGLATQEFGGRFFGDGTLATGILTTEKSLDAKKADALHERWRAKRAGLKGAHEVMILDNGAKFEQLTIPPEDAQFLQTRDFQTIEYARMFGVPPFLMFQTEKSTSWGTGLEQQAIGWTKFDLRRWYMRVEQRLTKSLAPDRKGDPNGRKAITEYARYNVEGLQRGDSKARAEFYRTLWQMGVLSTNEIRALEDMAPVDDGDIRYRPLNMGELGEPDPSDTQTQEQEMADASQG